MPTAPMRRMKTKAWWTCDGDVHSRIYNKWKLDMFFILWRNMLCGGNPAFRVVVLHKKCGDIFATRAASVARVVVV